MIKVAIVGTGNMASIRAHALLSTNNVELCGVASRRIERAKKFASEFNISYASSNYRDLILKKPDALLVELPHKIQDEVVLWAMKEGMHVLIGGCLSTTSTIGKEIISLCQEKKVLVECGYEARYKPCWIYVKQKLKDNLIGTPCVINAIALWDAPAHSWYYSQSESGGMPITHITYAFINPLRWLFGDPLQLFAMSNRIKEVRKDSVNEESCLVNIKFANNLLLSLTTGYITAPTKTNWQLEIFGTKGMLEVHPGDLNSGLVQHYSNEKGRETFDFYNAENAFNRQAKTFINAINNIDNGLHSGTLMNPPDVAINDIKIAEAIVDSSKKNEVIFF
ncbi:MAG: Gfo/Idh/MocA family oxidoreductase [Gammaproteobacteria bacterium]|nr:Gfo/Idh/MocA family oxidoreductase [Gammaproteobacteria bacterium]